MSKIELPEELQELRNKKIFVCFVMVWNDKKHNGHGGYDKPPVNPYTLRNGSTDNPEHLATFEEAVAQVGKMARVRVKDHSDMVEAEVVGVGIALSVARSVGLQVFGIDLDNVVSTSEDGSRTMTKEASEIITKMRTYTEISPSGEGIHILGLGKLPENIKKIAKPKRDAFGGESAEYQLFESGYMTISGKVVRDPATRETYSIGERSEEVSQVYEIFFREVAPLEELSTKKPSVAPSVVSCGSGYTFDRWRKEMSTLSDDEIKERIFQSGSTGEKVRSLYNGKISEYGNDHSRADFALVGYVYSYTQDRALTERIFRSSKLYRETGKSRNYINKMLTKAEQSSAPLVGHIVFTKEEQKQYAQTKELEEKKKRLRELQEEKKKHPERNLYLEMLYLRGRIKDLQNNKK